MFDVLPHPPNRISERSTGANRQNKVSQTQARPVEQVRLVIFLHKLTEHTLRPQGRAPFKPLFTNILPFFCIKMRTCAYWVY
jgi:hypothetical protein